MDITKDYYAILQVAPDADAKTIRKAYYAEARKYHPDTTEFDPEYATKRMAEINEAYQVLGDEDERRVYDMARQQPQSDAYDYAEASRAGEAEPAFDLNDWEQYIARIQDLANRTDAIRQAMAEEVAAAGENPIRLRSIAFRYYDMYSNGVLIHLAPLLYSVHFDYAHIQFINWANYYFSLLFAAGEDFERAYQLAYRSILNLDPDSPYKKDIYDNYIQIGEILAKQRHAQGTLKPSGCGCLDFIIFLAIAYFIYSCAPPF